MSFLEIGILLALLSSGMTAATHAFLKSGQDKFAIRALFGIVSTCIMLPICVLLPLPKTSVFPWLLVATSVHIIYQLTLIRSYQSNDFAVAYPIARGVTPISTAVVGLWLLGDEISSAGLVGICAVSFGILLIAYGRSISKSGIFLAVSAGLLTTVYTVVDAHTVRMAENPMSVIAWFFVLEGVFMFPIFVAVRRGRVIKLLAAEGKIGIFAGVVNLVSFGTVLMAFRLAPVGIVSALLGTSVVIALAIATFILKERIDVRHFAGAGFIVSGVAAIALLVD